MAKDFAFTFYPGDYLRDTQCLSEKVQVAYDRIMCEHMRNICITQAQLKFFTKKLNDDEVDELKMVLQKVDGGFQIEWVVASILKSKRYSESRSKNRTKKKDNICKSHEPHMEYEYRDSIIVEILTKRELMNGEPENEKKETIMLIDEMLAIYKRQKPGYGECIEVDYPALLLIAYFIAAQKKWSKASVVAENKPFVLESWDRILKYCLNCGNTFYERLTIDGISSPKNLQKILEEMRIRHESERNLSTLEKNRVSEADWFTKD